MTRALAASGLWERLDAARLAAPDGDVRARLAQCYDEFCKAGDAAGQLCAAAAVIEAILTQRRDFQDLPSWRARAEPAIIAAAEGWPQMPRERELGALTALALAARIERFASLPNDAIVERIDSLLADPTTDLSVDARLMAAAACAPLHGEESRLADIEASIARVMPLLDDPQASPLTRARWLHAAGTCITYLTKEDRGFEMWRQGRDIARRHDLHLILFDICHDELVVRLGRGLTDHFSELFGELERALDRTRVFDVARWYHLRAREDLAMRREAGNAREYASTALQLLQRCGYPEGNSADVFVTFAYACAREGDVQTGVAAVERVAAMTTGEQQRQQRSIAAFLRAYSLLRESEWDVLRAPLGTAFAEARRHQWFAFRPVPEVAARLCDAALQLDVEADYVRKVIQVRRLAPPTYLATWPWPIRVRTLGRFEAVLGDAPLQLGERVPRKTLELLKFLAGCPELSASIDKLVASLWSDLDGDMARGAFRIALHRVRKLLNDDEALLSQGGRVSLNTDRVWVDTRAFELLVSAAENALQRGDHAVARHHGEMAIALYRGHFLAAEEEANWQVTLSRRLGACFQRVTLMLGEHYEQCGLTPQARAVYLKGIEIDPLAEDTVRQLMVLLRKGGEHVAALEVYRALRHQLSVVLGMAPSEQTQRVYQSLLK